MVPLSNFLIVGAALFSIGIIGLFLNRKNVITILMCIELMLLAININFAAFSHFLGDLGGQIMVFFVLTVAASEVAVGLAILVAYYRQRRSIAIKDINTLQG
ncbi:MAG: NADH-quinone oxidoreductase subunit NuoK [Ghiorsea sp.]